MATTSTPLRRNRDWLLLMTGSTVSAVGNGMSSLAFLLLTLAVTGSATRASLVAAAVGVGELVMMLPAGALVDRWNRKQTMVWTAVAGAVAFGTIPLADAAGVLTFWQLLVVGFVEGVLGCFYGPAERGALKRVVPPEQMGQAMSVTMARSDVGSLLGSPLAGALFAVGRALPLAVDALGYLWAAGCAALVRTPLPAPERTGPSRLRADIREGLAWVWRTAPVRDITGVAMLLNLGITGILAVALLALQRAGVPSTQLGLLECAAGVAGILGALVASPLVDRLRIGTLTIASTLLVAAACLLMPWRADIWWVGGLASALALLVVPANAGIGAYAMHITPDAMQGRSGAAAGFVCTAMIPVANALAGFALDQVGRTWTMLGFGGVMVLATVACVLSRPIRSVPRAQDFEAVAEAA